MNIFLFKLLRNAEKRSSWDAVAKRVFVGHYQLSWSCVVTIILVPVTFLTLILSSQYLKELLI